MTGHQDVGRSVPSGEYTVEATEDAPASAPARAPVTSTAGGTRVSGSAADRSGYGIENNSDPSAM